MRFHDEHKGARPAALSVGASNAASRYCLACLPLRAWSITIPTTARPARSIREGRGMIEGQDVKQETRLSIAQVIAQELGNFDCFDARTATVCERATVT